MAAKVVCKNKGCRKELTQPYAKKMGICVSCYLKQRKFGLSSVPEKAYGTTDPVKILEMREKHREYYRTYRRKRREEGLAS